MHTPIRIFFCVLLLVTSALGIDQSDITGILREMTKMNERLNGILDAQEFLHEKFNEMDGRLNEVKDAISEMDGRFSHKISEMDGRFSQGLNEVNDRISVMDGKISDLVIALDTNVKYSKDQHDFGSVRLEVLRNVSTKKKIHRGKR